MAYSKQQWKEEIPDLTKPIKDAAGKQKTDPQTGRPLYELVQEGTRITSGRLNHIEDGIADAHTQLTELSEDIESHASDAVKHLTAAERTTWNAKETPAAAQQKADASLASAKSYTDTQLLTKADKSTTYSKTETDQRIQAVVGAAPATLDTLKEIGDALNNDPNFAATVTNQLSGKVDKVSGKQLSTEDFTSSEKSKLAGLTPGAGGAGTATDTVIGNRTISDTTAPTGDTGTLTTLLGWIANLIKSITGKSSWRTAPATTLEAAAEHNNDNVRHITAAERTSWNSKETPGGAQAKADGAQAAAITAAAQDATGKANIARDTAISTAAEDASSKANAAEAAAKAASIPIGQKGTAGGVATTDSDNVIVGSGVRFGQVSERSYGFTFNNNVANQRIDFSISGGLSGYIEVTITGVWSYANPSGRLTKRFDVSTGPTGTINYQGTQYTEVTGPINQIVSISNLYWDTNSNKWTISIHNRGTSGDSYGVVIRTMNLWSDATWSKGSIYTSNVATPLPVAKQTIPDETFTYSGYKVWNSGNDGAGSGSDADLLDGMHADSWSNGNTVVARDSSGNINAGVLKSTVSAGTAPFAVNSPTKVPGLNVEMLNGKYSYDFAGAVGYTDFGGEMKGITTAEFVQILTNKGAFAHGHWIGRGSWAYDYNAYITDTGWGQVHLAGAVVEVTGVPGAYTIRVITPATAAAGGEDTVNAEFIYTNNGAVYEPGWRKVANSYNIMSGAMGIGKYITNADIQYKNGLFNTPSNWTGSPFVGVDGSNQGYVDNHVWNEGASYGYQMFMPINSEEANKMGLRYRRKMLSAWGGWKKIWSEENDEPLFKRRSDIPNGNLNDVYTPGSYATYANASYTNGSGIDWTLMNVYGSTIGYMAQDDFGIGSTGRRYRSRTETGYWTEWYKYILQQDLTAAIQSPPYAVTVDAPVGGFWATFTPAVIELTQGLRVTIKTHAASVGPNTLKVNGLEAKPIKKPNGNNPTLTAGGVYSLVYDGSVFQLQGEGGEYGTAGAAHVLSTQTFGTEHGLEQGTMPLKLDWNGNGTSYNHHLAKGVASTPGTLWLRPVNPADPPTAYQGDVWIQQNDTNFNPAYWRSDVNMFGLQGQMPVRGALSITPGVAAQTIPEGYHNGQGVVAAVAVPANKVLAGTTIAGTAGTVPVISVGDDVAEGVAQWGDGALAVYPREGYRKGGAGAGEIKVTTAQLQTADPDLAAANIIAGKNIYGVAGTAKRRAEGSMFYSNGYINITGLPFTPSLVRIRTTVTGSNGLYTSATGERTYSASKWGWIRFDGNYNQYDSGQFNSTDFFAGGFTVTIPNIFSQEYMTWTAFE